MSKFNKGEWSELYTVLKLILDKHLELVDSNGEGINNKLIVDSIKCPKNSFELKLDKKNTFIFKDQIGLTEIVSYENILNQKNLDLLLKLIISKSQPSFSINEAEELKNKLLLRKVKLGDSKQKSDIILDFSNNKQTYPNEGFSIKSYLGSKPTLLNASGKNTNFIFEVCGCNEEKCEMINSIIGRKKIIDRIKKIYDENLSLVFVKPEVDNFDYNLRMIDTNMPIILSELILGYYRYGFRSLSENINFCDKMGLIKKKINYSDVNQIKSSVKRMLIAFQFGIFQSKKWDGSYSSNGMIVVKKNGDLIGFHLLYREFIENYIFKNITFEKPSTSRHKYAEIYLDKDNKYKIKLNLQLRYK